MRKGTKRAICGALVNSLLARPQRYLTLGSCEMPVSVQMVITHPDDELAIYQTVRRMALNKSVNPKFTLITNGTQGFEPQVHDFDRKTFGKIREEELHHSLYLAGHLQKPTNLCDERSFYEAILSSDKDIIKVTKPVVDLLYQSIENHKPSFILVNDCAGGNIMHDISNYLTCRVSEELPFQTSVIEYWQPFLNAPSQENIQQQLKSGTAKEIIGDLSYDEQGRVLRNQKSGKYTVSIPQLGIRKGRAFNGIYDIIFALSVKNKVYRTQKKSLTRLEDVGYVSFGLDAPHFREVDLTKRDFTHKPHHGVMYEQASHRIRGLDRLPTHEDFVRFVNICDNKIFYKKT